MLEGTLVDLVPQGRVFRERDQGWRNGPARFWTSGGDREFFAWAQTERRWQQHAAARQADAPRVFFGIHTKASATEPGLPIGFIGLVEISYPHRLGMLGARIGDPGYWGGGYGTDALLLIADYAFGWLDLRRLWLKTMGSNVRVHRQMKRVGFVREGEDRAATFADGERVSWVYYGLQRDEWPGRAALVDALGWRARAENT